MVVADNVIKCLRSTDLVEADTVCAMAIYASDRLDWVMLAVESVFTQTCPVDLFVIILDGPVSENLKRYVLDSADQRSNMIVLSCSQNVGLSVCMNAAIEISLPLGPRFFFRMDADDVCRADRIEQQLTFFAENRDIDVVGSWITEMTEEGKIVGRRVLPLSHKELVRRFGRRCPINHPSVAIRYSIFEAGHRYRPDMMNTQDYFLWVDLAKAGYKFANIKEKLLSFRRVDGFYKRRGREKSLNEFRARLYAMKALNCYTLTNICYATAVLFLRMMPAPFIKWSYKIDRAIMKKKKH